ncbi:hypothetical protein JYT61_01160, partial [bacterium AH-315-E10]|nr:hypothetical protein [bacterium AH-315-E10]
PHQTKQYLHRAGRTGRAGEQGVCVSLMNRDNTRLIKRFEKELDIEMQSATLREGIVTLNE